MKRILVAALLLAACHGDVAGPHAGSLAVTMSGSGAGDGALVFTVSGGAVSAVHAAAGYQIAVQNDDAGTHVILVGPIAAGVVATVDVPDLALAASYVATVDQAADGASFVLRDPAAYRLALAVAP
ncbi:MAG TPA: hypothetical protein VHW65_09475 [Gemmatimonadales bacterium]|jgi:hypothetical protein|nr:hypothetical protein [Gemmatimonadales bacterium]